MTKKPLNFAQALRRKTPLQNVLPQEQLPIPATIVAPPNVAIHPASLVAIHQPEMVDSLLSTTTPLVDSKIATIAPLVAIHQTPSVDSHPKQRKGDRHSKSKIPFNNRIDAGIHKRIKHFCVAHNLELQEFVELAAIHYMDVVDSHQKKVVDSKLAIDDGKKMITYKTSPIIISTYLRYNPGNRWKPRDDEEAKRYNKADIRLIEMGLITTQFNAQFKKINSFKYYVQEIELALSVPLDSETIDIMLKQSQRRWIETSGRKLQ